MFENLPAHITLVFYLTTLATLLLFYWAIKNSNSITTRKNSGLILIGLIIWLIIQAILTLQNVYNTNMDVLPPKLLVLGVLPMILLIVYLFATSKGRQFIDSMPLKNLTYLHVVRVPVEIVLFWLFLQKTVPQLMTFEGRNFDILAGITAPLVAYFGFTKLKLSRRIILIWNLICLGLVINIALLALFSTPFPLQKLAFDQPNIAILNFPISWLPTFIVPVVLLSHLTAIRQLINQR